MSSLLLYIMLNSQVVEIKNMKFNPSTITVSKGETITFINKDSMLHNVVSEDGKIESKMLKKDQVFTVKVDKGFKYYCQPHKAMMKGEVKVKQ